MTILRLSRASVVSLAALSCWACAPRETASQAPTDAPPAAQTLVLPAGISTADTCVGKTENSQCWMELANKAGCFIWNSALGKDEVVTWTGECKNGLAQGEGTQTWIWGTDQKHRSADVGMLVGGKRHGHWIVREGNGDEQEGSYVDGKRQGTWVTRWADGNTGEGPIVDDEMHGEWLVRRSDGTVVEKRRYVNGAQT